MNNEKRGFLIAAKTLIFPSFTRISFNTNGIIAQSEGTFHASLNKNRNHEIKDRLDLSHRLYKKVYIPSLGIKRPTRFSTFVRPRITEDRFISFCKKIQQSEPRYPGISPKSDDFRHKRQMPVSRDYPYEQTISAVRRLMMIGQFRVRWPRACLLGQPVIALFIICLVSRLALMDRCSPLV